MNSHFAADDVRNATMREYCIEYEKSLSQLERGLYHLRNPEDIIMGTLKALCEFYEADWSGILDADLELGVWTPIWWYNALKGDMTDTRLYSVDISEGFSRWEKALLQGQSMSVLDVEALKDTEKVEYEQYQRMEVERIIGAPYHKRSSGFLVVRNPKRFQEHISFLQVLTYVVASEVDEQKLVEGRKMIVPPQMVKRKDEVYISLFGEVEIYSYRGRLTDEQIKSPKICRIITYLLLHRRRAISARELAEKIWPNDIEGMIASVRSLIYRFRKIFRLICDEDLIETMEGKYRINPRLNIVTDMEVFERLCNDADAEMEERKRIHILKKAVHMYKGSIYSEAGAEHWLIPIAADFQLKFLKVEEKLLKMLAEKGRYQTVYDEAKRALSVEKGNLLLYYWMIYSLIKQGTTEIAKQTLQMARACLTEEDYKELVEKLRG